MMKSIRNWFCRKKAIIWYSLCFAFLGLIDQRRGSATGDVQMMFANAVGLVTAALLLPSLKLQKCRDRIYVIWTLICIPLTIFACILGVSHWPYAGQWIMGVLNITVWSYLWIYLIRERKEPEVVRRLKNPLFLCLMLMFLLMQLSRHEGILPLWYAMVFGGFFLIGIPGEQQKSFCRGLLNGIILWFLVQQVLACALRPYDYIRYRGLYSGETQNGLFYMMANVAFLLKWLQAVREKKHILYRLVLFLLSAACISLELFTGGRAPLVGTVLTVLVVLVWYDLLQRKSFYRFVLHGTALVLSVILLFPVVYLGIRYLPTLLHHPIWFEGEYNEENSVRSFDPWDSERYISFDEIMDQSLTRYFRMFGITVHAAEAGEPGSSPENPYFIAGLDYKNSINTRKVIYRYYLSHLNWTGHSKEEPGFWISATKYYGHAHNMFLQQAYDYGILAGLLLLGLYLGALWCSIRRLRTKEPIALTFLVAILGYGMFEAAMTPGQITVSLLYILLCTANEN